MYFVVNVLYTHSYLLVRIARVAALRVVQEGCDAMGDPIYRDVGILVDILRFGEEICILASCSYY